MFKIVYISHLTLTAKTRLPMRPSAPIYNLQNIVSRYFTSLGYARRQAASAHALVY